MSCWRHLETSSVPKAIAQRAAARKSTAKNPDDSEIAPEQWLVGVRVSEMLPCNRLTARYLQIARRTCAGHEQQKVNLCQFPTGATEGTEKRDDQWENPPEGGSCSLRHLYPSQFSRSRNGRGKEDGFVVEKTPRSWMSIYRPINSSDSCNRNGKERDEWLERNLEWCSPLR